MNAEPARRRIWLCADDYGIAPGVNAAICDLLVQGRINATSVMAVAPSFDHAAVTTLMEAQKKGGGSIGLHLTLTAPFRPLSGPFRPLADTFLPLPKALLAALLRRYDATGLQREIEAQLAAFSDAFGRPPDFVDGHQHVQLFPQVREALIEAVKRRAPNAWLRQCGSAQPVSAFLTDPKGLIVDTLSRTFRRLAQAAGLRTNTAFSGTYVFSADADFAALFPRFIAAMPEGGLVMCHPGRVDAALRAVDPLTVLREKEYAYLKSDIFPQALSGAGVSLM